MGVRMTAAELVQATGGRLISGTGLSMIEAVCTDSRHARPGSFFVAIPGPRRDGHTFIEDAFSRGAIGACIGSAGGCRTRIQKNHPHKMLIEVAETPAALGEISRFWRQKLHLTVAVVIGQNNKSVAVLVGHIARKPLAAYTFAAPSGDRFAIERQLLELDPRSRVAVIALGPPLQADCARHMAIADPDIIALTCKDPTGQPDRCPLPLDLGPRHTLVVSADDQPTAQRARKAGARSVTFGTGKGDVRYSGSASPAGRRKPGTITIKRATIPLPALVQHTPVDILPAAAIAHALGISSEDILTGLLAD